MSTPDNHPYLSFQPLNPAELRATAEFLNAIAAIREGTAPVAVEQVAAAETQVEKPKKTRAAKQETAAPAAEPEAKKDEPTKQEGEPNPLDAVNAAAEADAKADHDEIRKLIGELSQAGKRTEAVATVKSYQNADGKPCNGVGEIQDKDLNEIAAKLRALKG